MKQSERNLLGFLKVTAVIARLTTPSAAQQIEQIGNSYSSIIRAAIGPEELLRANRSRYVQGDIDREQWERECDRIFREFPERI